MNWTSCVCYNFDEFLADRFFVAAFFFTLIMRVLGSCFEGTVLLF